MIRILLSTLVTVTLLGCVGARPRVLEVSHHTRTRNVVQADEPIFLRDRSSHVSVKAEDLPAEKQREEFFTSWTTATITLVKFQYRQLRRPNQISEQSFTTSGKRETTFFIPSEDFINGGPVSAWRVSLWTDATTCVAEKKSTLW